MEVPPSPTPIVMKVQGHVHYSLREMFDLLGEMGGELERDILSCEAIAMMLSVLPSNLGWVLSTSCQLEGVAEDGWAI